MGPVVGLGAAAVGVRALTIALLALAGRLPHFDSAASVVAPSAVGPLLRWDTHYFAHTALHGYQHEHELAFAPALPFLLRLLLVLLPARESEPAPLQLQHVLVAGTVLAAAAGVAATLVLYKLTLALHPRAPTFALVTATLFLLPPSPPTLNAVPYTEPFFALTSFLGMLLVVRQQRLPAALVWAAGTLFRAQGIVLGPGFFGWHYLLDQPRQRPQRLLAGLVPFLALSAISVAPFFAFQRWAWLELCTAPSQRPWCDVGLGTSYGWIQREYWDVGPLRYWTLAQLPNFVLAAPVLALSLAASLTFYAHNWTYTLRSLVPFLSLPLPSASASASPFLDRRHTPFVHLSTALTLLLLVASHVQIILRLCASNPVVFWYAASLVHADVDPARSRGAKWGTVWVSYCVVWGVVSTLLWATFLPPA